jgi:tetratricopeptide (TPR) repeat protein
MLASTLGNIGIFYASANSSEKVRTAQPAFDEAVEIFRVLTSKNPGSFRPDLAGSLLNSANVSANLQNFHKSEANLLEALSIFEDMEIAEPGVYLNKISECLNNLGNVYRSQGMLIQAIDNFEKALSIDQDLAVKNPAAHRSDVAEVLINLGIANGQAHKQSEAQTILDKPISERQVTDNLAIARLHFNWAASDLDQNLSAKAQAHIEAAVEIFKSLRRQNPGGFRDELGRAIYLEMLVLSNNLDRKCACELGHEASVIAESGELRAQIEHFSEVSCNQDHQPGK